MELIEVSDQSFLQVNTGQNLILHGFSPAQFVNDGGGGTFELLEEFPTACVDSQTSFVQVIEPSPTVVVNYVIGSNGSLIPVYESLPIDNAFTFVTGAPEPPSESTVPPHILDHMYARKPKEPGTETPTKPRKRVKKKEPPPPIISEYVLPDIISQNTTKVNIIRKGSTVQAPQPTFRPVISSRPKILQNTKTIASQSPQKTGVSSTNDLPSAQSPSNHTSSTLTLCPSSTTTSKIQHKRMGSNSSHSNRKFPSPCTPNQTPSIYFLPPKANPSDVSDIVGSDAKSMKTSFIVTTTDGEEDVIPEAEQMCLVLSPTHASSSTNSRHHSPKTDVDSQHHPNSNATGQVRTFQLNSDGTISAVPSEANEAVIEYSTTEKTQKQDHHEPEMYSEFSICSFSDNQVGSTGEGTEEESTTEGSFQLGDKQIFFSYE